MWSRFIASCRVELQGWKRELCLKGAKWSWIRETPLWCFDYLLVNNINMRQAWAGILHQNQIPLGDAHAIVLSLCFACHTCFCLYPYVTQVKNSERLFSSLLAFFRAGNNYVLLVSRMCIPCGTHINGLIIWFNCSCHTKFSARSPVLLLPCLFFLWIHAQNIFLSPLPHNR